MHTVNRLPHDMFNDHALILRVLCNSVIMIIEDKVLAFLSQLLPTSLN